MSGGFSGGVKSVTAEAVCAAVTAVQILKVVSAVAGGASPGDLQPLLLQILESF